MRGLGRFSTFDPLQGSVSYRFVLVALGNFDFGLLALFIKLDLWTFGLKVTKVGAREIEL
jgi:hypothetical protein